jgi:3-hexulose-6-phosphate synthase/6-phospho-3-hexuloisomerase
MSMRARLEALSAAAVEDARGKRGALSAALARISGEGVVAGPARTALCDTGSVSAVLRALAEAEPGDVLVAQGAGEIGYFGELTGAEAVRRSLAAVVVDGMVRDVRRLRTLPLAVFATGVTPRGGLPEGSGEVDVPLRVGEEDVRPGDWIVADEDGVVVVPAAELDAVATRAEEITAAELACWDNVLAGQSLFDQASQDGTTIGSRMRRAN